MKILGCHAALKGARDVVRYPGGGGGGGGVGVFHIYVPAGVTPTITPAETSPALRPILEIPVK